MGGGQWERVPQPRLPSARPRPDTGSWCCSWGGAVTALGCARSDAGGARRPVSSAWVRRELLCWAAATGNLCSHTGAKEGLQSCPSSACLPHRAAAGSAGGAAAGPSEPSGTAGAGAAVGALPLRPGALPAGPVQSPAPLPALLHARGWCCPTAHWAGGLGAAQPARRGSHTVPDSPVLGGGD